MVLFTIYSFNETRDINKQYARCYKRRKEEIIGKIDEIESITNSVKHKKDKWICFKTLPYVGFRQGG